MKTEESTRVLEFLGIDPRETSAVSARSSLKERARGVLFLVLALLALLGVAAYGLAHHTARDTLTQGRAAQTNLADGVTFPVVDTTQEDWASQEAIPGVAAWTLEIVSPRGCGASWAYPILLGIAARSGE